MSGSDRSRDDEPSSSSAGPSPAGGKDPCQQIRRGPINSPKAAILSPLSVGSILGVSVISSGSAPILAVTAAGGAPAGSLTFIGYLEIIDCIRNRGVNYKATIVNIAGGVYEVRVEPL
jgi:hypothetical protein